MLACKDVADELVVYCMQSTVGVYGSLNWQGTLMMDGQVQRSSD